MDNVHQPADSALRDDIALDYFARLHHTPYPAQEAAILAWFTAKQGVAVCAPTGTGKTLIAEAAVYEALRTGQICYYTTPLIALTEQKFADIQALAVEWGYAPEAVGLVTGNRRVNPQATVLVVVAEILLNRLLDSNSNADSNADADADSRSGAAYADFDDVQSVVMDEFHSFNDAERGIVWELTLGLLPRHVRTLLLSATVGNAVAFTSWLRQFHGRDLQLVQSNERKVPLTYRWVGDQLLYELLEDLAQGDEDDRYTPALVFCFNREECWSVAEQLRGKRIIDPDRQQQIVTEIQKWNWNEGAGPRLKSILVRGVGVHHAGVLPQYRRVVEQLFEKRLLSFVVCTETLAAGINLPARSAVFPSLVKGPPGRRRVIGSSGAQQMFGRAGRPQFDTQGFVFALAHGDDVQLLRWQERYDQIPADTKDPQLRKAKKAMAKKKPKRNPNETYWTETQFRDLTLAAPTDLASRGRIPWRLLVTLLEQTAELTTIRELVAKRFLKAGELAANQRYLDTMLVTLHRAGFVRLEPEPLLSDNENDNGNDNDSPHNAGSAADRGDTTVLFDSAARTGTHQTGTHQNTPHENGPQQTGPQQSAPYQALRAQAQPTLGQLRVFRAVNPLFGHFVARHMPIMDSAERIQALEAVLAFPESIAHLVRVPAIEYLPPGQFAANLLDQWLLKAGLVGVEDLVGSNPEDRSLAPEERVWPLKFADKLLRWFEHQHPQVNDIRINAVWAAGAILEAGGDFGNFVVVRRAQRQEGLIFRHLLRLVLLITEFLRLPDDLPTLSIDTLLAGSAEAPAGSALPTVPGPPTGTALPNTAPLAETAATAVDWREDLQSICDQLVEICNSVDAAGTKQLLEEAFEQ